MKPQHLPIREDVIHEAIAALLRFVCRPGVLAHSIPNEGLRSARAGARLKRMGMKPGAADFIVSIDGRTHYLEIKTPTGRQSPEQRAFELECTAVGIPYAIVRSSLEAEEQLRAWGAIRGRQVWGRAA